MLCCAKLCKEILMKGKADVAQVAREWHGGGGVGGGVGGGGNVIMP